MAPRVKEKPSKEATKKVGQEKKATRLLFTACFWALLLFFSFNFILWRVAGEEKQASKDLWNGTGSIDLAIAGLANLKQRPTVVLLGSSLMMYPFWAMDKEKNNAIPDIFHHHFSHVMEGQLAAAGWQKPCVYSLAIFGQMASDAYIYVDEFLKGNKRPDWLVLGIAPRDFSDYDLQSPTSTYTFQRLVGLANFDRYASLYLPGFQERTEFLMNHLCFFYSRRWRLQKEFDKVIDKAYQACGLNPQTSPKKKEDAAGFMLAGRPEVRWANSLSEYKRRYRNIGDRDLGVQMGFLDRLLATCTERKIKVVIINMPLTDVNRALLPPGFYAQFRNHIAQMVSAHDGHFLDLGDAAEFLHEDYWDTTHLNHAGGKKLLKRLIPVLTQNN